MLAKSRKWIIIPAVIALTMAGCADDDLLPKQGNDTNVMFNIALPASWGQIPAASTAKAPEVTITPLSGCESDTLYMVSRAYTLPDSIVQVNSRGTQINDISQFHAEAGLSAICYTGAYPDDESQNGWTTNLAHNLKLDTKSRKLEQDLPWPGSGNIRFFAYAPYGGATHSAADHKGSPTITFTVNTDPEKQVDLMTTATAEVSGSNKSTVELHFKHALTGILFKAKDGMLSGTVNKITISGVYGSGTSIIGSNDWTHTSDTYEYVLNGPFTVGSADNNYIQSPEALTDKNKTLFLLPQTLPTGAKIAVSFTDNLSQAERTLTANLTGKWEAGKLVTYSISTTGIVVEPVLNLNIPQTEPGVYSYSNNSYKPEEGKNVLPFSGVLDNVKMQAYLEVTQSGAETKRIPAKVRFESLLDDGNKSESKFIETGQPQENADYTKEGYICMEAQPVFNEMRTGFVNKNFIRNEKAYKGSKETPFDLSTNGGSENAESSNCYVVNTPGYYKIPVVYGNSLNNPDAYTGVSSEDNNNVWAQFKDHTDEYIASQWIDDRYKVTDAKLIWQDSPGLVTDIALTSDGKYITFEVREASLNQGNALIAVRDESGTILWSWHIYATHYDWSGNSDIKVTTKGDTNPQDHNIAPCNVGYCDRHGGNESRTIKLNIYFTLPNGEEKLMTTRSFKQEPIIASAAGDNTYYQWGRKDPMLPGIYNSSIPKELRSGSTDKWSGEFDMINKVYFPANGYKFKSGDSKALFSQTIEYPNVFYMHNYIELPEKDSDGKDITENKEKNSPHNLRRRHWHEGEYGIFNAWDSQRTTAGEKGKFTGNDAIAQKSVYDPSPRGYNVPHSNAFSGLLYSADVLASTNGYKCFYIKNGDTYTSRFETMCPNVKRIENDGMIVGWEFTIDGGKVEFYATGLRDMGYRAELSDLPSGWVEASWPAHRNLTFVTSATTSNALPQCLYFGMDERKTGVGIAVNAESNNAYGFSVRPERKRK